MRYQIPLKNLENPRRFARWPAVFVGLVVILFFFLLNPVIFVRGLFLQPALVLSEMVGFGKLAATDGRTNILILGLDRRKATDKGLTDTIMVGSVGSRDGDLVLFSVPRDVWIGGISAKINAAYAFGGVSLTKKIVAQVLGIPIHYFVVVDFEGFKKAIDAVSGITVEVEEAFEDFRYPIPGREGDDCGGNDPEFQCRYEHLKFEKGVQNLDGETALKYARSRQSASAEGSDFARDLRQQRVIRALLDKAFSFETLINPAKIRDLYQSYVDAVETDLAVLDVEKLYGLSQKVKAGSIKSYVIERDADGGKLLYTPADFAKYNNQWVLLPRSSDFAEVRSFVQKVLFGQ